MLLRKQKMKILVMKQILFMEESKLDKLYKAATERWV